MECTQECQTFLWGGTGTPRIDDAGDCYCVCEGDEWSTYNILGVPSCVPSRAHFIFGLVGLLLTISCLCHSAHQLNRQVEYHAHNLAAATSPMEQCRRQLHVVVVIHGVLSLGYFSMVLGLEDHQLWVTVVVMSGINQFTTNIGGMLTLRMWIYTNDPRLMQETPEIMAISNALEQPAMWLATRCAVCIGAVSGTILSAARYPRTATKVACLAFISMCIVVELVVCKCGMSLLRTINKSLLQKRLAAGTTDPRAALRNTDKERGGRLDDLLVAKRTIRTATSFCLLLGMVTVTFLTFSVSSPLGMLAPLLFFATPMGMTPALWFGLNIQLHAGRSKRHGPHGALSGVTSTKVPKKSGWNERTKIGGASVFTRGEVAVTEGPALP